MKTKCDQRVRRLDCHLGFLAWGQVGRNRRVLEDRAERSTVLASWVEDERVFVILC